MALPRLRVNVGPLRQAKNPPYPSHPTYVAYMQESSKALTDLLLDILDQFEGASNDLMYDALQPTFEKAKVYTPKDTMALVDSAYFVKTGTDKKPRVEMGFARGGKPYYAVYVHEILSYKHAPPTRAKFLEVAVKEDYSEMYHRLGRNYYRFMNGVSFG